MKILKTTAAALIFGLAATLPTACSDDDAISQLESPEAMLDQSSVKSLEFSWEEVEGATQYALELYDPAEKLVETKVTNTTSQKFTGLAPATEYTLKIWAYGPLGGDKSTSPTYVLKATTDAIVQLAKPVLTANANGAVAKITWDAVANADYYAYSYEVDGVEKSGTVSQPELGITGLGAGTFTVYITAVSDSEAFSDSETASVTFTRTSYMLWEAEGVYYSAYYNSTWTTTIQAYSDGSYIIPAWYTYQGYDLIFSWDEANQVVNILNTDKTTDEWGWTYVPTGIEDYPLPLWLEDGWCGFSGTQFSGELYLYNGWTNDGFDTFSWEKQMTMDDLVGTYACSMSGQESTTGSWLSFSYDYDLEITKYDNTYLVIHDFYWNIDLYATFDAARQCLILPAQEWGWYRFCYNSTDADDYITLADERPVEGYVSDDLTITLDNWTATYDYWPYFYGTKTTLKKY